MTKMFTMINERIEVSKAARLKGNEYYKCDRLIAAVAQYNKALVLAGDNKEQAALCYGNRSAVYLKLNYFQHCLHNIDLAEPQYPAHKIQKLHDRRKECLKMMKSNLDKAMKPFDYRAKLSYKPNPKIPFFIDALQLRDDPVIGKHIITTQHLKAGDIIGIIEPWQVSVNDPLSDCKLACYNCLNTNNGDLIPGKGNVDFQPLFCSKKCRDEHLITDKDHEGVHEFEKLYRYQRREDCDHIATSLIFVHKVFLELYYVFGSVETMRTYYESHEKLKCSFFEFDWSMLEDDLKYQENMLLVLMSELGNLTSTGASQIVAALIYRSSESQSRLIEIRRKQNHENGMFMDQLLDCINACTLHSVKIRPVLSKNFSSALINSSIRSFSQSCDANTFIHHENHDGSKKIVFIVNQPISANEMVTIPADNLYYLKNAAKDVKKCDKAKNCTPCRENWATMIGDGEIIEDAINNLSTFFRHNDPKKVDSMLTHRRKICNFINENFTDYNENPKTRYKIAVKKKELNMNLKMVGNPTPQVNPAMGIESDYHLNVFRYALADSHALIK